MSKASEAEAALVKALALYEPAFVHRFVAAVARVKNRATQAAITRAIEMGEVTTAIELVSSEMTTALQDPSIGFGTDLTDASRAGRVSGLNQLRLSASLDLTNPAAASFAERNLPTLIREIDQHTQIAVRDAISRGFGEGRPAPKIAREIRDSIGLTQHQSLAVQNFRRQLETGDMGTGVAPWNRRLSAAQQAQARAIFQGGGETSKRVDAIVSRYNRSLVNRRAKNIARTEVHRAFISGQKELWDDAAAQQQFIPGLTRRVWIVTDDDRLRSDHAAVPGMNPGGVMMNQPYQTPVGPADRPGESGIASFDINCRCTEALEFME